MQTKPLLTLLFAVSTLSTARAQAPQFTQLYNHPTYHNPALAGEMGHARAGMSHRNQWRGVYDGIGTNRMPFQTTFFSYDTYLQEQPIGIGIYAFQDNLGANAQTNALAMQGSFFIPYLFGDNGVDDHLESLEAGLEAAWYSTRYSVGDNGLGGLTFVDQFTAAGPVGPSADPLAAESSITTNALIFSTGFVYKRFHDRMAANSGGLVIGLSVHDLLGSLSPMLWDGFMTARIAGREDEESYSFTARYRRSSVNQQADWLLNCRYPLTSDSPLVWLFGGGIRAIPWRKATDNTWQRDALLFMGGFEYDALRLSASVDAPISTLQQRTSNGQRAGLAFEVSATYSLPRNFMHKLHSAKTSIRGWQFDKDFSQKCNFRKVKGYMAL